MKKVLYDIFFNNGFTSHSTQKSFYIPFWWDNMRILKAVFEKEKNHNHANVTWVKVNGKKIWKHPIFRNDKYSLIVETERQILYGAVEIIN